MPQTLRLGIKIKGLVHLNVHLAQEWHFEQKYGDQLVATLLFLLLLHWLKNVLDTNSWKRFKSASPWCQVCFNRAVPTKFSRMA